MKKLIIFLFLLLAVPSVCFGEILQLHLANQDTEQAHRKQAGDVISVHDRDHAAGYKTQCNYLILYVDFDVCMTSKQEGRGLQTQLRESCGIPYDEESPVVGQARFKIDLTELDSLAFARGTKVDWKRLRDPDDTYQPFYPDSEHIVFDYSDLVCDKCQAAKKLTATELRSIADAVTGVISVKKVK